MPVSLWDFALDKYRDPHVAQLMIRLQDEHGASVCELLWATWLASAGRQVSAAELTHFRRLHNGLYLAIQRLRGARRLLELDPLTRELGQQTRPLEIEAEKCLLQQLEHLESKPLTQDPFTALHQIGAPFGLPPAEPAQKLYTELQEHLARVGVEIHPISQG